MLKYAVTTVLEGALNVIAVPVSACAQGAPVSGSTTVDVAGTAIVAVVAVPARVHLNVADVPELDELATSNCQTRMLCPVDDATRIALLPVPVTATLFRRKIGISQAMPGDAPLLKSTAAGLSQRLGKESLFRRDPLRRYDFLCVPGLAVRRNRRNPHSAAPH